MTGGSTTYLLDANVLITAHRSYYAFNLCPGFWESIQAGFAAGQIFSTRRVLAELQRGADRLKDWAEAELPEGFFMDDSSASVMAEYAPMMQWVQSRDFHSGAKTKFASDADGWLVATAKDGGHVLVTHETRKDAKARVPMPNVCDQFGVEFCNTFEMLNAMGCSYR